MIREGQIVLFRFPQTDQSAGKLRPALVLRKVPGVHDDWLICMLSSNLGQAIAQFDEVIRSADADFKKAGLKQDSVIRIARMAVVHKDVLRGTTGEIAPARLARIKSRLSQWIAGT